MRLFIGVGCVNCGTTWIARSLARHPDIFLHPTKELQFFTDHFDKGTDYFEKQMRIGSANAQLVGEWSPGYIYSEAALKRIHQYYPNATILTCFRNPIDRLVSHYRRYRAAGAIRVPLDKAIYDMPSLIQMGMYAKYWKHWVARFGSERSIALIYEDFVMAPSREFNTLAARLSLSEFPQQGASAWSERVNAASDNANQWIMDAVCLTRDTLKGLGASRLVKFGKRSGLRSLALNIARGASRPNTAVDPLLNDQQYLMELYDRYFRCDVEDLEGLIGRETCWRN